MNDAITKETTLTVGLDVGDRYVQVCVLDEAGEVVEESRLPNKRAALERRFAGSERLRIVLEAGTHSPWLARLLEEPSSSPHSILGQPPPSCHGAGGCGFGYPRPIRAQRLFLGRGADPPHDAMICSSERA